MKLKNLTHEKSSNVNNVINLRIKNFKEVLFKCSTHIKQRQYTKTYSIPHVYIESVLERM